ncbi:Uncharacterised protein [Salmonella enterica subsp. enterica serovar Sanjuan]|uniref:Uncharacterized protein n=1 Tax=Salmonella enterica subsp. enterica serovar Sanjuan TaxID=1160765 RepID=A0A447NJ79_SALET|nr:Uncharacterised protein [Salmonella enterica subsp. enterica serovar Sanjuan]
MKKLLKMFFKEIYETFISPHILLAIFILVFYLSHVFLSDYNGGLPMLISIIVTLTLSWVFHKFL